jgi:hypothetical protein
VTNSARANCSLRCRCAARARSTIGKPQRRALRSADTVRLLSIAARRPRGDPLAAMVTVSPVQPGEDVFHWSRFQGFGHAHD